MDGPNKKLKDELIESLVENCFVLIIDQFGNYVIQSILLLNESKASAAIAMKICDNIQYYSKHRYSSNVIEKCFDFCGKKERKKLIEKICSPDIIADLILDEHGNYVVQKALFFAEPEKKESILNNIITLIPKIKAVPFGEKLLNRLFATYPQLSSNIYKSGNINLKESIERNKNKKNKKKSKKNKNKKNNDNYSNNNENWNNNNNFVGSKNGFINNNNNVLNNNINVNNNITINNFNNFNNNHMDINSISNNDKNEINFIDFNNNIINNDLNYNPNYIPENNINNFKDQAKKKKKKKDKKKKNNQESNINYKNNFNNNINNNNYFNPSLTMMNNNGNYNYNNNINKNNFENSKFVNNLNKEI